MGMAILIRLAAHLPEAILKIHIIFQKKQKIKMLRRHSSLPLEKCAAF